MDRIKEKQRKERIEQIRRRKENMTCANCTARRPTDVCITFNTFVCQQCAGVHREFSHRIKGISASTFSEAEVDALANGGNRLDAEMYLAKWRPEDFPKPDRGDVRRIKQFVRSKYVDKQWYSERRRRRRQHKEHAPSLSRADRVESLKDAPPSSTRRRRRRRDTSVSSSPQSVHTEAKQDSQGLDFLRGFSEPVTPEPKQPEPKQPEPKQFEPTRLETGGTDDWADFDAAPTQPAQPPKPKEPEDSWMSVFSQGESTQRTAQQQQRKQEQYHNVFGSEPLGADEFDVFGAQQQQQAPPQNDNPFMMMMPATTTTTAAAVAMPKTASAARETPPMQSMPPEEKQSGSSAFDPFADLLSGTSLSGSSGQAEREREQQAREARREARLRRAQHGSMSSAGGDNPFMSPVQAPVSSSSQSAQVPAHMQNGMQAMPGMQGMPGMQAMQGVPGMPMQGMPAMQGMTPMQGMPGMSPMQQMTPQMMAQMQAQMQAQMLKMQQQMQALSMMQQQSPQRPAAGNRASNSDNPFM